MTRPREGALLLLILVAGAWLRLRAIDRLPPPELHPDEAYYALDALKIMRGQPMVYSAANTGREALFMDLAAAVFAVFGVSSTVLRAFTAVLGALTLPAIFWLGREAAPRREEAAWLGLLSAASVAALLLHVVINRNALRVNMQPLATALALAALLRGFRLQRRAWFVLAGVLLGLSAYTYVTVRLLPLVILLAFALWWPDQPAARRAHLAGLAWVAGLSALVYLPLAVYFWQHPGQFLYRARGLFTLATLGRSSWVTLLIFYVRGDPVLNSNLPLRPVFDLAQGAAFAIGAAAALWGRYRQAGRLMLAWLIVSLIPSAFANDAPSYIHAFGMVPPLAVLMGMGALAAGRWLAERLRRWLPATTAVGLAAGLVVAGLGYSLWRTYTDYFDRWAARADLGLAYRADLWSIFGHLQRLPADTEAFLSPYSRVEAPLEFYLGGDTARLHPYDGHYCLPLGDSTQHPLAYFVSDPFSLALLQQHYPSGQTATAPKLAVFSIPAGAAVELGPEASNGQGQAEWAEQLALRRGSAQLAGSQRVDVSLTWETRLDSTATEYHRFVHLLSDEAGQPGGVHLWAQDDDRLCHGTHPPASWQPREYILDPVSLQATEPLPAGQYRVVVGLYAEGAPARLAVTRSGGPVKDEAVTAAVIMVR